MITQQLSAEAVISGSARYPKISGYAHFTPTERGTLVYITLTGLPGGSGRCSQRIFGAHIHGGGSCSGNMQDPFADAGTHYDPTRCPHPYHAGDLPPIFAAGSDAMLAFMTDRFTVEDIIGRTIIIHSSPDDLHTQPAGNSGEKIACGMITRTR